MLSNDCPVSQHLQNVYIVHQAATKSKPPKVGLLGLTDPDTSMQNFRAARGDDPTGPVPVLTTGVHHSQELSAGAIYGISAAAGFVLGALLTILISLCYYKRYSKW